ncbi:MAG: hypothetical protein ABGU93_07035 [Acetobacterium sp.]|uniref:hypothetical protein n=1 Tax=Acetobacterium sp. TaxID=1872094 RepID=UPI0032427542
MSNKSELDVETIQKGEDNTCFVIMPISDPDDYAEGHFKKIYDQIFCPAIKEAGFKPKRADDDSSCGMIQAQIIMDIVNAPMALCDLSTRNPNVLFELGLRQAFDLPVVLVQEEGTPRIFDIANFSTIDYRNKRIIDEVEEDRKRITDGIKETKINTKGINSIIKLLRIEKATAIDESHPTENDTINFMLNAVLNRIDKLEVGINNVNKINPDFSNEQISKLMSEIKYLKKQNMMLSAEKEKFDEERSLIYNRQKRLEFENNSFRIREEN